MGRELAGFRWILALIFAICAQYAPAFAQDKTSDGKHGDVVLEQIIACLAKGEEAVLFVAAIECKEYRRGTAALKAVVVDPFELSTPYGYNAEEICKPPLKDNKDWRRLGADAIKRIAAQQTVPINPSGIRIIGAIFCERLDLIGLDLAYSLVIDRSFFGDGVEARNFHTRGDFSFDGSYAVGSITFARSRVDGTIYGTDGRLKTLQILDSEIHGSVIFRRSVFQQPLVLDTVALSGELSIRQASLSYFFLQFSKVNGVLDLTESQAKCAYLIRKSEIGDLVAVDGGFGMNRPTVVDGRPVNLFDWSDDKKSVDKLKAVNAMSTSGSNADACKYLNIASPGSFLVSDTSVRSSLCMRSFHWLSPRAGGQPTSYVRFNDLTVGATTFVDLTPASNKARDEKHNFEAIGMKTRSLIFNFMTGDQIDHMTVSGLAFEQVYAADFQCKYDSDFFTSTSEKTLENIPRSNLRQPKVTEVMAWLNHNCTDLTQPFSAFVDAAQKSGDANDAKQLRIARASKELGLRFRRLIGSSKSDGCEVDTTSPAGKPHTTAAGSPEIVQFVGDFVTVVFGTILAILADHGYRPEKVGWFVGGVLLLGVAYFWAWLHVVAFVPIKRNVVRPIGLLFLFDRVLPAYRIRDEHYEIRAFYRLARAAPAQPGQRPPRPRILKYFGKRIRVVKASPAEAERTETVLDVIKVIGLVLAIFLVAAINALVSH